MSERDPKWWWLSFADAALPQGEQNLGCVLIAAPQFIDAVCASKVLGVNPGGEVMGWPMPDDFAITHELTPGRLYSRADLVANGRFVRIDGTEIADGAEIISRGTE